MNDKRDWVFSALLSKHDGLETTYRHIAGYKYDATDNEAVGWFTQKCMADSPGFALEDIVKMQLPPKSLEVKQDAAT